MKKLILGLVFVIIAFLGIDYFISNPNNVEIKIKEIKEGFSGVIQDKYAVRDTPPTHLKVEIGGNNYKSISPNQKFVRSAEIGDSIYKPDNSNYIFLIKKSGQSKRYFYTKLSYKTRNSKRFPEEWRDQWLESSEWDNKNIINE
jgi:hypothetical protein